MNRMRNLASEGDTYPSAQCKAGLIAGMAAQVEQYGRDHQRD
jgi:hypothetical protein